MGNPPDGVAREADAVDRTRGEPLPDEIQGEAFYSRMLMKQRQADRPSLRWSIRGRELMSKPRLNVAFLTGDTDLNVSLVAALSPPAPSPPAGQRELMGEELEAMYAAMYGGNPAPNYAEFETAERRYTAIEYGSYEKPRRMLLNAASCLDGAVLTVFASEGLGVVTRNMPCSARQGYDTWRSSWTRPTASASPR
jgi:hypothetical protein